MRYNIIWTVDQTLMVQPQTYSHPVLSIKVSLVPFGCMLSVGTIHFEDRFCASKKGGMGEVDGHIQDMPCTWRLPWLPVEQTALVSTGWTISHLGSTNGCKNHSSLLVGASFPDL